MKYAIDSKTLAFSGKGIKPLFKILNQVCRQQSTDFLVVGAFARDLILHNIFGRPAGVLTKDIDFGIMLSHWQEFQQLTKNLVDNHGFTKGRSPHVFVSPHGLPIDLLPFGEVENNRAISFPEIDNFSINMMGFTEAWNTRQTIVLDGEQTFSTPTPEGLILLKLMAWNDRTPSDVALKHVTDISMIVDSYFDARADELDRQDNFTDLYDLSGDSFNMNWYAAVAIGRIMGQMVQPFPETRRMLLDVFREILDEKKGAFFRQRMGRVLQENESVVIGIIERLQTQLT